ncbi:transporter substrate-binding domain-containing protein [Massilia sp. PAMC28688]|uniref:substrate-binding periplasmic protein n=1 Tax=Massilia sp. PAMC28688 TaxID=2861283 RepID=UPI001C6267BF|nr:transporter substrate-binding domain-containing protein [Massilia sp. PAMC28688]QYF92723.1 transporter substrate-binding domain-containing protein [Massilia sp. PAMC28688]
MAWRHTLCCCLLVLLPCLLRPALAHAPVTVLTSELPPMAMAASPLGAGAQHEMVLELGRRTGIPFAVSFVPWRRAMLLSVSTPRTAIFPLTRSPEREARYRWLAPLYRETFLFLSLKGSSFDAAAPERSKHLRIAILRGSLMVGAMQQQGYRVVEASSVAEALRLLQRGIVHAVVGNRDIFIALLRGQRAERFVMSAPVRETATWLGGSLDFTEGDAALLQGAMKQMTADGTYAKILRKYKLGAVQ